MYEVIIEESENLFVAKLNPKDKTLIKAKLLDLQNGNFSGDKALKGKYKGKFRKRAGKFRIIYIKDGAKLLICVISINYRKDIY
ncbi:type II toxin-antitoxin system RelE family toxin [Helicobacter sp. 23-1045]